MERIVYIIGAGFSAPAGIPTIRNFLTEANELYSDRQDDFSFFEQVFERLDQLGHVGTFYSVDLKNIEDVLSMLEMRAFASGSEESSSDLELFERFICSVINAKTPQHDVKFHGRYRLWMLGRINPVPLDLYASFVLALHNMQFSRIEGEIELPGFGKFQQLHADQRKPNFQYDVISLNYDRLLENSLDIVNCSVADGASLLFDINRGPNRSVTLAKLHGDSSSGVVVCPTWNKSDINNLRKQEIKKSWQAAYKVLRNATQIRILGYSLPVLDSYIRYLLKAAIHDSRNLKKIEVLCMDQNHEVENRYKDLMPTFRNFKFVSKDVNVYLSNCRPLQHGGGNEPYVADLEYAHDLAFR